jgi:hypothetical protein
MGDDSIGYGIWANDIGDDSIDTVILHIDMGYLVTLPARPPTQTTVALLPHTLRTRRVRSGGTHWIE